MESGEYFLKPREREAKETQKRKEKVNNYNVASSLKRFN